MKKTILLFVSLAMAFCMQAQNTREYIKQNICDENECKSVAITEYNGDAMIYGRNGWAAEGCPNGFTEALHELNYSNEELQDIHLTENGRWLVLYGNNGMQWHNIYDDMKGKMLEYNTNGEQITTVTFNDMHDWIIVTSTHISASSNELLTWLGEGCEKYGQLWTACITNDAAIAVYENGFRCYGNVPEDLKDVLSTCTCDIYTVKIAGTAWFIRCTDGYWRYNM